MPVLAISDSGGAASDIAQYCLEKVLPVVDDYRDEEYVRFAKRWLPRIKELGEATFNNDTPQLSFFSLNEDINAPNDLALVIQRALLNDCPDVNQEALCAVAWAEPALLRRCLETDAKNLLDRKKELASGLRWLEVADEPPSGVRLTNARLSEKLSEKLNFTKAEWKRFGIEALRMDHYVANGDSFFVPDDTEMQVDLLQVALAHKDVKVVRTLISFAREPL